MADFIDSDSQNSILAAVREGCRTFISGMACGVDIWAAEIVVRMKEQFPDLHLHLIAAIPYAGFDERWPEDWRERYRALLGLAEYVKVVEPFCSRAAYQKRNEWMVNHSARVIAVYNGQSGGTRNTIRYARKQNVPVILLPG
jgi:uncharacterized phage-like protein YoqJ